MHTFFGNQRYVYSENSDRENWYKRPNFKDFDFAVQLVAIEYIRRMSEINKYIMHQTFKKWKKEPNKLKVNNVYNSADWRAIYTQELFWPRMLTVEYCIRNMLQINQVKSVLEKVTTIASIGCGPGPDIASTISILRSLNLCHHISVVAIDQYDGWQYYINSMRSIDDFTRITFQKMKVDENSVKYLDNGDMCLMSYTDAAIHTSVFWKQLKRKYKLILILDQNNSELFFELNRLNFKVVEYVLLGNKRFCYFMQNGAHRHFINRPMPNNPSSSSGKSRNCRRKNLKKLKKKSNNNSIKSNVFKRLGETTNRVRISSVINPVDTLQQSTTFHNNDYSNYQRRTLLNSYQINSQDTFNNPQNPEYSHETLDLNYVNTPRENSELNNMINQDR